MGVNIYQVLRSGPVSAQMCHIFLSSLENTWPVPPKSETQPLSPGKLTGDFHRPPPARVTPHLA